MFWGLVGSDTNGERSQEDKSAGGGGIMIQTRGNFYPGGKDRQEVESKSKHYYGSRGLEEDFPGT